MSRELEIDNYFKENNLLIEKKRRNFQTNANCEHTECTKSEAVNTGTPLTAIKVTTNENRPFKVSNTSISL